MTNGNFPPGPKSILTPLLPGTSGGPHPGCTLTSWIPTLISWILTPTNGTLIMEPTLTKGIGIPSTTLILGAHGGDAIPIIPLPLKNRKAKNKFSFFSWCNGIFNSFFNKLGCQVLYYNVMSFLV